MDISFLKKNCGAEREGKKEKEKKWQRHCRNRGEKKKKLFCGNGIAEIEGKKTICHFFFPLYYGNAFATFFFPFYFGTTIILEIICPQHFYFLQQILSDRLLLIVIIGAKK